jgi:hypothetical protein
MIDNVITELNPLTPGRLTHILSEKGALDAGTVLSSSADSKERDLSTGCRIKVSYSEDARGAMPDRLFLKMVKTDMADEFFGPSEVDYYTRDYIGLADAPLVRCYHARYSEKHACYHLLMDDLAETHVEASQKAPSLEYGQALAAGLAAMHAHWWGRQRLEEGGAPIPDTAKIARFVDVARPGLEPILHACSDQLASHWPQELRQLFDRFPKAMVDRTRDGNGFTLIHGDVNPGNVQVPKSGHSPLYILDRQPFDWSLTTWLGAYDLSYPIVHHWEIETRRLLEIQILKHYHEHLISHGVTEYPWEQLYDDYRLSAVISVFVAVEWCRGGVQEQYKHIWLPMLQRAMTAIDDLECRAFWQ